MFYDYYKLLNIEYSASTDEIKVAYDKKIQFINKSYDIFSADYQNMIVLLSQAYHTLIDENARLEYDSNYNKQISPKTNYFVSNLKPQIHYLKVDKQQVEVGDIVKISWHTVNCDQVILLPFGPVKAQGELNFNVKTPEDRFLKFSLLAENTVNGQQEKKEITLRLKINEKESSPIKHSKDSMQNSFNKFYRMLFAWFKKSD
jgi:hypothetical protein